MGLPSRLLTSVVYNWSYGAFKVLHKTKSFSFGLESPTYWPVSN